MEINEDLKNGKPVQVNVTAEDLPPIDKWLKEIEEKEKK